ncbi:MAG: ribonuclease Z [Candidatus Shapirobacteria bacterium]
MKVTILGTGTFYVDLTRSAQSYLIEVDNKKILVDCGPGTLMRLSEIGLKTEDLDYIFLTHFHPDHSSDLFAILMGFRLKEIFHKGEDFKTPIICGPAGIQDFIKKLSHVYELPAFDTYSKVEFREYQESMKLGEITVKTFKVDHIAFGFKANAYALRFEFDDSILAFSGDSTKCDGLVNACEKANLFICDASFDKSQTALAHLNTTDIGEVAEISQVDNVVLSHFYPETKNIDLVAEVKEKYSGEVIMGEDLMELEI